MAAVVSGTFAACSSGGKGSPGKGSGVDASTDAFAEATDEAAQPDAGGGGPDDSAAAPEGIDLMSPDGCYRLGAFCQDNSTCCSANCVDAACSAATVQMIHVLEP